MAVSDTHREKCGDKSLPLLPFLPVSSLFLLPCLRSPQNWALCDIFCSEWSADITEGGTQQMLIFPTRRVVFQEEVKLIGHTLHKVCGNTSSYGNNAGLDAVFLRHIFMHSCMDFDTLRELFGVSGQYWLLNWCSHRINVFAVWLQFWFQVLLRVQLLRGWLIRRLGKNLKRTSRMLHHPPCWKAKLFILFHFHFFHLEMECEVVCSSKVGSRCVLFLYSYWWYVVQESDVGLQFIINFIASRSINSCL